MSIRYSGEKSSEKSAENPVGQEECGFFCYLYRIAVRGILRRERLTFAHKLDRMELRFYLRQ